VAAEALTLHARGLIEDGEPMPEPSSLEAVMSDRENQDGVAMLVRLADAAHRSVRINITVPEPDLQRIDRFAEDRGYTRSGFLVKAAREAMERA
jgi:hypothetical protein